MTDATPSPTEPEMSDLLQVRVRDEAADDGRADARPAPAAPLTTDDVRDVLTDDVAFGQMPGHRLGLLGGKGVGKSYLFQALAYRVSGRSAGGLAYFLGDCRAELAMARELHENARTITLQQVIEPYCDWIRLGTTVYSAQTWYRLRLAYRVGWPFSRRARMDLTFLEGSGESYQAGIRTERERAWWTHAFIDATVMVFCLPFWAAFPAPDELTDEDRERRAGYLREFADIVTTFRALWERQGAPPTKTVLALTMADDRRCGLPEVKAKWIDPYLDSPDRYLTRLQSGAGIVQYLATARQVSRFLDDNLLSGDNRVTAIPAALDFGAGPPWLVPVSAINGSRLSLMEDARANGRPVGGDTPPVPVHVELPLLLCLCQADNVLM